MGEHDYIQRFCGIQGRNPCIKYLYTSRETDFQIEVNHKGPSLFGQIQKWVWCLDFTYLLLLLIQYMALLQYHLSPSAHGGELKGHLRSSGAASGQGGSACAGEVWTGKEYGKLCTSSTNDTHLLLQLFSRLLEAALVRQWRCPDKKWINSTNLDTLAGTASTWVHGLRSGTSTCKVVWEAGGMRGAQQSNEWAERTTSDRNSEMSMPQIVCSNMSTNYNKLTISQ